MPLLKNTPSAAWGQAGAACSSDDAGMLGAEASVKNAINAASGVATA